MIEDADLRILGTKTLENKLGIDNPIQLAKVEADFTAFRLAELQTAPIRGGFDAVHLQEIHRHVYQDLYEWAGELRSVDAAAIPASDVERSLNKIFDRLGRENLLKGYDAEEWAQRASSYMYEVAATQPFIAGNEIAIRAFVAELARKNNLGLQWSSSPEIEASEVLRHLQQSEQSTNFRRMILLAMDTEPTTHLPGRGGILDRGLEMFISAKNALL